MQLTKELLAQLVRDSTETIKVCVPSIDYYRRSEDWTDEFLDYVCPKKLLFALENLFDVNSAEKSHSDGILSAEQDEEVYA